MSRRLTDSMRARHGRITRVVKERAMSSFGVKGTVEEHTNIEAELRHADTIRFRHKDGSVVTITVASERPEQ